MLHFFICAYSVVSSAIYFFLPIYLKDTLHFSGAEIGLLYGVLSLNAILVSFPVGVTGDRYPARLLTRLGLLGTAVNLWVMADVARFWLFLLIFWSFGLSLQLFRQSLDILLFKEELGDEARRFGHYNAWRMGGMMAGALLGGWLLYRLNFPLTLKLLSLAILSFLLPTLRLPLTRGVRVPLFQYRRDFFTRPVLFFAAWLFLFTLHWGAEATSLCLFLENNLALNFQGIGLYLAGEFLMVALAAYLYGRFWVGRLQPFTFLALALITSGLGHVLMTYPNIPWSFAWRLVHGFGDGLIFIEIYTTISRLFHVDRVGGNSSLISLTTTLGTFAGSLLFGPIGAAWGYHLPLIISGAISLALLPLAYRGLKE